MLDGLQRTISSSDKSSMTGVPQSVLSMRIRPLPTLLVPRSRVPLPSTLPRLQDR